MKTGRFLSIGLAALAVMVSACSQSSSPTAADNGSAVGSGSSSDAGILAKLQHPEVTVDVRGGVPARFLFTAGASGPSSDESMIAARTIDRVEFRLIGADGRVIKEETTREVVTTGVLGENNSASLTVFAEELWGTATYTPPGSYVVGTVVGRNGERLVLRTDMPITSET